MTSQEILAALADDPTERGLSEIPNVAVTWVDDPLETLDAVGHAVVIADDGLLLIPYTAVRLGGGWEQLDLDAAVQLAEPPDYLRTAVAYAEAEQALVRVLTDALAQEVTL